LYPNIITLCSSFSMRDQASHSNKATDMNCSFVYFNIYAFK
jgi:hypothetical protein